MPCPTATGSTALLLYPIFPSFRQISGVQHRGDLACSTLITMATLPPPTSIMSTSDNPAHPHPPVILSPSPQELCNNSSQTQRPTQFFKRLHQRPTAVFTGKRFPLIDCVHNSDSGTLQSLQHKGQILRCYGFFVNPLIFLSCSL